MTCSTGACQGDRSVGGEVAVATPMRLCPPPRAEGASSRRGAGSGIKSSSR